MSQLAAHVALLKTQLEGSTITNVRIVNLGNSQRVDSYDNGVLVCFDVVTPDGSAKTFSIADMCHPYVESTLFAYLLDCDATDKLLNSSDYYDDDYYDNHADSDDDAPASESKKE